MISIGDLVQDRLGTMLLLSQDSTGYYYVDLNDSTRCIRHVDKKYLTNSKVLIIRLSKNTNE